LALRREGNSKAFHGGLRLYVSQEHKHLGMKILQKIFLSTHTVRRHISISIHDIPFFGKIKEILSL
jgi:hypothetical protein